MRKSLLIAASIILLSFVIACYLYPLMPDELASHWDAQGQVDGYMPKAWALFLMPVLSVVLFCLFIIIPNIDPLKRNIEKFRGYYDWFIVLFVAFLFYLYLLTLFWNWGYLFNMVVMLVPAYAVLFFYIGVLTEHAEPNWFIGIRTPWTMSSEAVWKKTHEIGGKLFKIAGLFSLLGLVFQEYAIWIVIFPVLLAAVFIIAYSYFAYKKIAKK